MDWDTLLLLSIAGFACTFCIVSWVTHLGIRYRNELPKLPILESIEALRLRQEAVEADLADRDESLHNAKKTIREAEDREQWLQENEERRDKLIRELDGLKGEEDRLESVRRDKEDLDHEIEKLLTRQEDLEGKHRTLGIELAEIEAKLGAGKEELERLTRLKGQHDVLEATVPRLQAEHDDLCRKIDRLRQDDETLEKELAPLRKESAELVGHVKALTSERNALIKTIEVLKADHAAAGGVSDDQDPCEDLWKPMFLERRTTSGGSDEKECLDQVEATVRRTGLQLAQRTLYAFHTALKTQDMSPLTLLAGISGTGKSLIPSLYAKCMGLHFLNLPVQPGWNAPQDLFGFYNYIEQKYKATPLARAMVQFDPFNRETWPLPDLSPDLTDQLLLVLLDEMNLARVEYYFSELLSRLETRRSVDPTAAGERGKVEIPLEIGHGHKRYAAVSIYPGENVLFTGTMNEDESTQSLSDKVLDRATVLRFGKPASAVTKQPRIAEVDAAPPLGLETWNSWKGLPNISEETGEVIQRLGDLMDKVGAPFGHRVSQGIAQYVALYPDQSGDGRQLALADQIEQKLLPRLRGLDLSLLEEPLNHLQTVVRDLGDASLEQAIRQGRDTDHGTFLWTGLDRVER